MVVDFERAQLYINESGRIFADITRQSGDYTQAAPLYLDAIQGWRNVGNLGTAARCIKCLAYIGVSQARDQTYSRISSQQNRLMELLLQPMSLFCWLLL